MAHSAVGVRAEEKARLGDDLANGVELPFFRLRTVDLSGVGSRVVDQER